MVLLTLMGLGAPVAYSADLLKCEFHSIDPEDPVMPVVISKDKKGKLTLSLQGEQPVSYPVLRVLDRTLPNLQEMLACDSSSNSLDECMDRYSKKYRFLDAYESMLPREVLYMRDLSQDSVVKADFGLQIESIARVRKYAVVGPSKFGLPGLNEYYDANDRLIGRILFPGIGAGPCR